MSKENSPRFDVAARVATKKLSAAAPPASPDDILFRSAAPAQVAGQETAASREEEEEGLLRFGSQLPATTLIGLHRIAYWQRVPLYEVLTEALKAYGQMQPEADKPLPEKEWRARKLPRG